MISEIWDELYFGEEVDPSRGKADLPATKAATSVWRAPSHVGSNVTDLAIEDVEMFLEHVETQRDQPLGEPPSPPFYGRTTPMLYTDCEEQGNYWPDYNPPFATYQQLGHEELPGNNNQHDTGLYQTLATADGGVSLAQCCDIGNEEKNSSMQRVNVIVPDFTLLTGAFSPVQSGEEQTPVSSQIASVNSPIDTVPDPAAADLLTADDQKVKTELRDVIKKRRKATGKDEIVIDWERETQDKGQLTDRDIERRRRRRESNRRAAQKSRVKKREQNVNLAKDMDSLMQENSSLTEEVAGLRAELAAMTSYVQQHLVICPHPGNLVNVISPHR